MASSDSRTRPATGGRPGLRIALLAIVCGAVALLTPALASAKPLAPNSGNQFAPASAAHFGLGLIPTKPRPLSSGSLARLRAASLSLPASVDLSAFAMPVGNQGSVGSCAAWASDYSALGYWENEEGIAGGGLAPMYTYSLVTGGVDDGSTIEGNLSIDERGVDAQSDYWQGNYDYTDFPTGAETDNAVNWRLSGYSDLAIQTSASSTVTQTSIETALSAGLPVVIGIPVYDNFFWVGSANSGYYAGPSGNLDGYHAVTALGYNANGLVIENQWGTGWGNGGWATLSWSFVNGYVFDAVSVSPLVTGQPVSATAPTVSGTAGQGQTLTASNGTWNPAATSYSYQWERAAYGSQQWATIAGATGPSYVAAAADVGKSLRVLVSATGTGGQGAAASAAVGPVTSGVPQNTALPILSGSLRAGQTLSVSTGTWNPAGPTAYQWQRSTNGGSTWTNIPGAIWATYTTVAGDSNAYLRVWVGETNAFGLGQVFTGMAGPVLSNAPADSVLPVLSGTLQVGQTLSTNTGTWNSNGSFAYQWQRSTNGGASWTNIPGAIRASYTTGQADAGADLRVWVGDTNAYGLGQVFTSSVGPIVPNPPPQNTGLPVLSGTLTAGQTLSVSTGTWSAGGTMAYQWQRSTNGGASWTNIPGAIYSSYATGPADSGAELRVWVGDTNSAGLGQVFTAAVGPLGAGATPQNTSTPVISGTPQVGLTLSVSSGAWSMSGPIAYQWQRSTNGGASWTNIPGAIHATYSAMQADTGAELRAWVGMSNAYGWGQVFTAAVGPVSP